MNMAVRHYHFDEPVTQIISRHRKCADLALTCDFENLIHQGMKRNILIRFQFLNDTIYISPMGPGKAFELFVKRILVNIGFSEVVSDGLYIYDGTPGQMIQGLGEAHNADVLLEPPAQTPFYSKTRILIECKDYRTKIGLNVARSALGLREDINNFNIVDMAELKARRRQNRRVLPPIFDQYSYQVAIAALSGFTTQAQEFAAAYRIPLIEFNKLPFWNEFCQTVGYSGFHFNARRVYFDMIDSENRLLELADKIGQRMAVAITNSGQMLFLYHTTDEHIHFNEYYSLHWEDPKEPWILRSDQEEYLFQLPESILKVWLNKSTDELKMKREAINCKDSFLSHMVVYYTEDGQPAIKMISIDRFQLEEAIYRLG